MMEDLGTTVAEGTGSVTDSGINDTGVSESTQGVTNDTPVSKSTQVSGELSAKVSGEVAEGDVKQPVYTPNFKYRYAAEGKQVEQEIPDIFKPLIRDAETEKQIRELHEKAYGLDFVKQDRDSLKTQYAQTMEQYTNQTKALQTVGAYIKHKDYTSVFDTLNIPKEDVLQWALDLVQYNQMDPRQRSVYDQQMAERNRVATLELQNLELTQNFQQFAIRQRDMEVGSMLSRPDVSAVANAFDQRAGMPGAFRNEIIKRGQYYAYQGHDAPVEQVVMELVQLVGGSQPGGTAQPAMQTAQTAQSQRPPVIPNIAGKGTSPVKRVPKSLDDIRKIAAEMGANQ